MRVVGNNYTKKVLIRLQSIRSYTFTQSDWLVYRYTVLQTRKSLHSKVIFSEELYYTVY